MMLATALSRCRRPGARLVLAAALACALPPAARAQVHEAEQGGYLLRANVVKADAIPAGIAKKHGFRSRPDAVLLNVVVLNRASAAERPVRANVEARATNRGGLAEEIPMQAAEEAGWVSYVGQYVFGGRDTVAFDVRARPEGSSETLAIRFEERFVLRDR